MRTIVNHFYGSEDLVDLQLVRLSLILGLASIRCTLGDIRSEEHTSELQSH